MCGLTQGVNESGARSRPRCGLRSSSALTDTQRALLATKLANKLDGTGAVRVVATDTRSHTQTLALAQLAGMIGAALIVAKARKPTKPSRGQKAVRLDANKRRSLTKRDRRTNADH